MERGLARLRSRPAAQTVQLITRDAMVPARSFHRANFAAIDPLFQSGVADAEFPCGGRQLHQFHDAAIYEQHYFESRPIDGYIRFTSILRPNCFVNKATARPWSLRILIFSRLIA